MKPTELGARWTSRGTPLERESKNVWRINEVNCMLECHVELPASLVSGNDERLTSEKRENKRNYRFACGKHALMEADCLLWHANRGERKGGRKIPTTKQEGRFLQRREDDSYDEGGKCLRRLLRGEGTGVRGTGSARHARGGNIQRNTDRILDDSKMSDSPSSLHSSFL